MADQEITISDLGPKGDGVHSGPMGRVFVERAVPGDKLWASVHQDKMGVVRGEILDIVTPSVHRRKAPCPHYDSCGNCSLQHVSDAFYREWKVDVVKAALKKYGVRVKEWLPPIFIGEGQRRRATFTAYKSRGKLIVGYYRRRSQEIINIEDCAVIHPKLLEIRDELIPYLMEHLREDSVIDVFVQMVGDAVDVVFVGEETDENEPLIAKFGELEVQLPSRAFLQPTEAGEKALTDAILRGLPEKGRFADLFSGCGTFTGPMLARGSVAAFESDPLAIKALKDTKHSRLKVVRRDLYDFPLLSVELNEYDAVVFDPPRAGCPEQAVTMAQSKCPVLIGISCNPATFARDAMLLKKGKYRLQSVQIIDQFLWSHHVEICGVFART